MKSYDISELVEFRPLSDGTLSVIPKGYPSVLRCTICNDPVTPGYGAMRHSLVDGYLKVEFIHGDCMRLPSPQDDAR